MTKDLVIRDNYLRNVQKGVHGDQQSGSTVGRSLRWLWPLRLPNISREMSTPTLHLRSESAARNLAAHLSTLLFLQPSYLSSSVRKSYGVFLTTILLFLPFASDQAFANTASERQESIIVPLNNQVTPGEGAQFPFIGDNYRVLTIYSPSEFLEAMPEGGFISEIAFRLDETVRGRSVNFDFEVEVRMSLSLSLTTADPSIEFAKNLHGEQVVVFPRAEIHWESTPTISGPNGFDLIIPLEKGFYYDPRQGSLAIDLLTHRASLGNIYVDTAGADDYGMTEISVTGLQDRDFGRFLDSPVIQVHFSAIPEPSGLLILAVGLLTLAIKGFR